MKKITIALMVTAGLLLGGCGQNIEKIETTINSKSSDKREYELDGYTVTFEKNDIEKSHKFQKDNEISRRVHIDNQLSLTPLVKPEFTPDSYDSVEVAYKAIEDSLVEIHKNAVIESEKISSAYSAKVKDGESQIAKLNDSMSEYTLIIKEPLALYEAATEKKANLRKTLQSINKDFNVAIKKVIVEESIAIDTNKTFNAYKQYKLKFGKNKCDHYKNTTGYGSVPGRDNMCFILKTNSTNKPLVTVMLKYSTLYEEVNSKIRYFDDENNYPQIKKDLRSAKIIAKNKTKVDVKSIERKISVLQSKVKNAQRNLDEEINLERLAQNLIRSSTPYQEAQEQYSKAASKYNNDLGKEAFTKINFNIGDFSDEDDILLLSDEEVGIAVYVLKSDGNEIISRLSRVKSGNDKKSFYEIFKKSRELPSGYEINESDDIIKMLEETGF
jgi:hypothetical protein